MQHARYVRRCSGANNVCDPRKPYRDSVTVDVALTDAGLGYLAHVGNGGEDELATRPAYLVVRTEQKTWSWLLCLAAA